MRLTHSAVEQWSARKAHILEVIGSNPISATMIKKIKQYFKNRKIRKDHKEAFDRLDKMFSMTIEERQAMMADRSEQVKKDGWVQKKGGSWAECENGGYRIR